MLNPEILAEFDIGIVLDMDNYETFRTGMEDFVNQFSKKRGIYSEQLAAAAEKYSRANFIRNLLN